MAAMATCAAVATAAAEREPGLCCRASEMRASLSFSTASASTISVSAREEAGMEVRAEVSPAVRTVEAAVVDTEGPALVGALSSAE